MSIYGCWRSGQRQSDLARRWGVTPQTIVHILRRVERTYDQEHQDMIPYTGFGVLYVEDTVSHIYRQWTPTLHDAAQRYLHEGRTPQEVMHLLECSQSTVWRAQEELRTGYHSFHREIHFNAYNAP